MAFIIYAFVVGIVLGLLGVGVLANPLLFFALDIPLLLLGWFIFGAQNERTN